MVEWDADGNGFLGTPSGRFPNTFAGSHSSSWLVVVITQQRGGVLQIFGASVMAFSETFHAV